MSRRKNSDDMAGCLAVVFLLIFAMPLYGIYKMTRPDGNSKVFGLILTVVSFGIWLWIALAN